MKKLINLLILVVFTTTAIAQNKVASNLNNSKVSIGDYAYGGIVFFVDETGEHGLVCTKQDQAANVRWNQRKTVRKNNWLTDNMNTKKALFNTKSNKECKKMYAIRICEDLKIKENGVTYNDWYLPTQEELNLMYINKAKINETAIKNGGTNFADTYYWSSTEYDYTNAWTQYFFDGKQVYSYKDYNYNVRAVRAF